MAGRLTSTRFAEAVDDCGSELVRSELVQAQEGEPARYAWSGCDGRFTATMQVVSRVAIVTLSGPVHPAALPVCRSALEAALRTETARLILDLEQARVDELSLPLLTLMDRAVARRGVTLWLTGLTVRTRALLAPTNLAAPNRVFPSVSVALHEGTPHRVS